jgi:hypothetical protein
MLETIASVVFSKQLKRTRIVQVVEFYDRIAMIIALHLLRDNHVTGF